MKKFDFAAVLVLGVFVFYSAFGTGVRSLQIPKAHAEHGNDSSETGVSIQSSAGIGTEVKTDTSNGDNENEIENQDENSSSSVEESDNIEVELEKGDDHVKSISSLEKSIDDRENELESEASSTENDEEQEALNDHDQIRLAVHALLSSDNLLGGIGSEVSALAQDLNQTVTSTINEEVKIKSRGFFARLFFGGDREDAASLIDQVNQNKETIQKLTNLIANCVSCSADLKAMLQNRLTLAQDEQVHLEALAKDAQESLGIFGVIFRLFGK